MRLWPRKPPPAVVQPDRRTEDLLVRMDTFLNDLNVVADRIVKKLDEEAKNDSDQREQ